MFTAPVSSAAFATPLSVPVPRPGLSRHAGRSLIDAELPQAGPLDPAPSERGHAMLRAAFRPSGGIARGDDLARLLEYLDHGDCISLARHIADRTVFAFTWRETFWIPMFQFDLRDLSMCSASQAVLAELGHAYSGWSLACWFAEPNPWLAAQRPVDLLQLDLPAVREAARADRYALLG